jgi:hypothetical protein
LTWLHWEADTHQFQNGLTRSKISPIGKEHDPHQQTSCRPATIGRTRKLAPLNSHIISSALLACRWRVALRECSGEAIYGQFQDRREQLGGLADSGRAAATSLGSIG